MNRIILILICLLLSPFAQGQFIQKIGIKSGLVFSNQTWDYSSKIEVTRMTPRVGFCGGLNIDFFESRYFHLSTDLGYAQKGSQLEVANSSIENPEGDGTFYYLDTRFDYFTFSPMLKVKYPSKHWIPYALLGPRLDLLLSYHSEWTLKAIEDDFKKSMFGITAGAGLEYKLKQLGFHVEYQFQYDFSDVMHTTSTSSNNIGIIIHNQASILNFGMSYYFFKP